MCFLLCGSCGIRATALLFFFRDFQEFPEDTGPVRKTYQAEDFQSRKNPAESENRRAHLTDEF